MNPPQFSYTIYLKAPLVDSHAIVIGRRSSYGNLVQLPTNAGNRIRLKA
jgi:hypothetical protein